MGNVDEFRLSMDDTYMNIIKIEGGKKNLLILSGISLLGLEGYGSAVALSYRTFLDEYTIYLFDRKKVLPKGYLVEDLADDIYRACGELGIEKAYIYGISQGGMIAQVLCEEHPEMAEKLVLCSSPSRANRDMDTLFRTWERLCDECDIKNINRKFGQYVYSEKYLKRYRKAFEAIEDIGSEADVRRFRVLLEACLAFDRYDRLDDIKCPMFVLGDRNDRIIGAASMEEIAAKTGCGIYLYDEYAHAVYDEALDIKERVKAFFAE